MVFVHILLRYYVLVSAGGHTEWVKTSEDCRDGMKTERSDNTRNAILYERLHCWPMHSLILLGTMNDLIAGSTADIYRVADMIDNVFCFPFLIDLIRRTQHKLNDIIIAQISINKYNISTHNINTCFTA